MVNWLNAVQQRPECLLKVDDKLSRGFNHDVTGQLLCPVDYDWMDTLHVSSIYQLVTATNNV